MRPLAIVVDDNSSIREMLEDFLGDRGFEVLTAEDGEEGLLLLQTQSRKVELIITDYEMPKMNGLEFLKSVLRTQIHFQKLVVISGHPLLNLIFEEFIDHERVKFMSKQSFLDHFQVD